MLQSGAPHASTAAVGSTTPGEDNRAHVVNAAGALASLKKRRTRVPGHSGGAMPTDVHPILTKRQIGWMHLKMRHGAPELER